MILDHLQNPTDNDTSVNEVLLDQTEHFLQFGPGCTKGLDIPFECSKCQLKVMNITQATTKCVKEPIPHQLVTIHSGAKSCIYCGETFPMKTPCICPINNVPHTWN